LPVKDSCLFPGFFGSGQDPAVSEKVMRTALDKGITVLNTADFYTGQAAKEEVSSNIKLIGMPFTEGSIHSF
jgi:aryl-alcohol dehydrogenase-like predicted oxidoreductase